MAESKLTKAQAQFLTAIESGGVQPVANLDEGVTRKAMLWLGLASYSPRDGYSITPAGRAALQLQGGSEQ